MTVWQIPAPSERWQILAERLKDKTPISDKEYRELVQIMVAHLRTPLTGVTGYMAMLSAGDFGTLSEEQKKIIDDMLQETQRLIVIVNGLMELGKLTGQVSSPRNDTDKKYKVLSFEDDSLLRGMYQTKFQMLGFDFSGYESPSKDPVSIVLKERPDLILMDGIMPELNGLEATKRLKTDTRTRAIPILGLDNIGGDFAEKAKQAGMVDYLLKAHCMPAEVVNRVRQILGLPIPPEKPIPPVGEAWHGQSVQQMIEKAPKQPTWWQRFFGKE